MYIIALINPKAWAPFWNHSKKTNCNQSEEVLQTNGQDVMDQNGAVQVLPVPHMLRSKK